VGCVGLLGWEGVPAEQTNLHILPPKQAYFTACGVVVSSPIDIVDRNLDEMTVDKMTLDKMTLDKMTLDKMTLDKMTLDKMTIDKMTLDKMTLDKMT
jgi:pentapeptide MXKDX repeat protein